MKGHLVLEYRIRQLEQLLLEGKKDQEILQNFLGDKYYDKYKAIKNKIRDPEYKDIYKIIKMNLGEVKKYIDSFQSNRGVRKNRKESGATLVYDNNGYKIYRITTPEAAQLYGSHTKWCISGRLGDDEVNDTESNGFFDKYINGKNTEKAYYFIITPKNHKFCITRSIYGDVLGIWDEKDYTVGTERFFSNVPVGEFFGKEYEDMYDQTSVDNARKKRAKAIAEAEPVYNNIVKLCGKLKLTFSNKTKVDNGFRETLRCNGSLFGLDDHTVLILLFHSNNETTLSVGMDGHFAYKYDVDLQPNMTMPTFKSIVKSTAEASYTNYGVNQHWFDTI